jgi:hypothetical protein
MAAPPSPRPAEAATVTIRRAVGDRPVDQHRDRPEVLEFISATIGLLVGVVVLAVRH